MAHEGDPDYMQPAKKPVNRYLPQYVPAFEYKVWHFVVESPLHLEAWLQKKHEQDGLKLISANGDYYIFEVMK